MERTADKENGCVVHVLSGAPYDRYVGRAMPRYGLSESLWANPYKAGRDGDLGPVLSKFEEHISYLIRPKVYGVDMNRGVQRLGRTFHRIELAKLDGLTLACWCAPKNGTPLTLSDREVCHGQILLRLAAQVADELAS